MSDTPAAAAGGKKKTPNVLVLALLGVLVVGGGAGAYMYIQKGKGDGQAALAPPPDPGVARLEPFVVNLADPGGRRFLRATLSLVFEQKEAAKEFDEDEVARTRARAAVLELLAEQVADTLVTPGGKTALRQHIAARASEALEHTKVTDVLFTEFVVQF